jgi:restriction modification system DNA specificity domain protein
MIKVNKPKIRFKNFNDSWSLRKLSDTQTDFKDGNYGEAYPKETDLTSSTQGVPFLRGSDLDNGKLTLTNARYITQSKHNELVSGHLIEDDIVIAVRGSLGSLGYVGPDNEGWNINSQLAIIRTRKIELIGNYLIQFLLSNRGNKEISSHITGTALKQLPIKQLKNIKVPIPKIEEQSAIGSLFRTLDDLLVSYKDNLANYQSLKAVMLSKMFPKAGQTVPEIRLDGFEGEWEEKKLGEIVDIVGGGTPDTNVKEYWNGEINWFSPTEVGNSIYLDTSEKRISELGLQKSSAKILPANRTILFTSRAGIGSVGIITKDSTTNQGFQSLVIKEGIDIYFLFSYSSEITRYALKHSAGSTFLEISGKELGKMDIIIPTYEEQQAIGAYFSILDNLINSHQEKITQLETLKKKLLQDMFI